MGLRSFFRPAVAPSGPWRVSEASHRQEWPSTVSARTFISRSLRLPAKRCLGLFVIVECEKQKMESYGAHPAVVTMCPVFLLGLCAGQWTTKIRMDFCGIASSQKRKLRVSASKARTLSHCKAARQRSLRSLDSSRMGSYWAEEEMTAHPGVRAFGDQKPFEERFLDFQTFFLWDLR